MKIRTQLILVLAALALLPLLAAGLIVFRTSQARLDAQSDENLVALTRVLGAQVDDFVFRALEDVRTDGLLPTFFAYLSSDSARRIPPDARLNSLLTTVVSVDPVNITSSALFDRTGAKLADTDPTLATVNESERPWIAQPLANGLTAAIVEFPAGGRPALWVSAPVRLSNGMIAGVLRVRYELTALQQIVTKISARNPAAQFALIVDDRGRVLAHGADAALIGTAAPAHEIPPASEGVRLLSAPWTPLAHRGGDRVGLMQLQHIAWRVAFVEAESFHRRASDELLNSMLELGALLILLGAVAAAAAAARFSRPIRDLAHAAEQVGHGELAIEVPVTASGEVGALTRSFNRMTQELREKVEAMRAAERSLRASEHQLAEIFEHTTDVIFLLRCEADGRFVYERINHAVLKYGFTIEQFTTGDKTAHDLFPPSTAAVFENDYRACIASRAPVNILQRVILPLGDSVLQTTLVPVFDPAGAVVRIVGFVHDVTVEHRQQEMLEQTQRLGHVGGWEIDCTTETVSWTPETYRIHDLTPEEHQPSVATGIAFYVEEDRPMLRTAIDEAIRTGGGYDLRLRLRTAKGRIVPVRTIAQVECRDGRPVRIFGAFFDLTELTRIEQEVRRLNAELEHRVAERTAQLATANAELEAFSYSVSHDLRAPLRAIDGFSRALQEDYAEKLDDPGRDFLRRIRTASQRMGLLIDDLLKLARVSRGELHREALNLTEMAREIAAELQRHNNERQVEFVCSPGLEAQADRNLIRIALENLLDNAWKYTRRQPAPRIVFRAETTASGTVFCVEDNGAGFDLRYAGKLFGAFQRLHSPAEFEGTGVGLATVRRIVMRHGGRIWAEAEIGQGAKFKFTLDQNLS